jgi:CRISPR-associated protein Csm1
MDDTVLKVALAGLLHDIGKFAENRLVASPEFLDANAHLYQPFFNNQYTHRHAAYTAAFIDHIEKLLPKQLNKAGWGLDDPFINLAAGHHLPETPMQWIIAVADRISSGWDRDNFEKEYNQAIAWKNFRRTRLIPLFASLMNNTHDGGRADLYRYPLRGVSPQTIFPLPRTEAEPTHDDKAREEYKTLFDEFIFALKDLKHKDINQELCWSISIACS